jgi:hypothetical protein
MSRGINEFSMDDPPDITEENIESYVGKKTLYENEYQIGDYVFYVVVETSCVRDQEKNVDKSIVEIRKINQRELDRFKEEYSLIGNFWYPKKREENKE